jgi:hypothetical protein
MIEKVRSIAIKIILRDYNKVRDRAAYRPSLARRASTVRSNADAGTGAPAFGRLKLRHDVSLRFQRHSHEA